MKHCGPHLVTLTWKHGPVTNLLAAVFKTQHHYSLTETHGWWLAKHFPFEDEWSSAFFHQNSKCTWSLYNTNGAPWWNRLVRLRSPSCVGTLRNSFTHDRHYNARTGDWRSFQKCDLNMSLQKASSQQLNWRKARLYWIFGTPLVQSN